MPVIRISDHTFRRLQSLAVPLVDSPSAVIDRLLDLHERSSKMSVLTVVSGRDPTAIPRLAAAGGYLLLAQQGWIQHHVRRSVGGEAYYCRGVGAPMRNVAIGAPIFCAQTGETPHRVHMWGTFGGWEDLSPEAAWDVHRESLGADSLGEWRQLIATIPSLRGSDLVGLIRLEGVAVPAHPVPLDPLGVELRRGAIKGRSLGAAETARILEASIR